MAKKSISIKIAILAIAFVVFGNASISPAMAVIMGAFPDVSMINIQLVMTFGLFGFFPMSMLTGGLMTRFRAKTLSMIGSALLVIGCFIPLIVHSSIWHLYISSLVMGAGGGMMITLSGALVPRYFPDDAVASRLFGLVGAFQNAGSMIMMFAVGFFAATQWYNAYWFGVFMIPTFFLILFLLPKDDRPDRLAQVVQEQEEKPKSKGWDPRVLPIAIYMLFFSVVFATPIINSAILMEDQLNQGPAMAGFVASVTSIFSIVAGILYKNISDGLKQTMLGFGALFLTLGVVTMFMATNVPVYFIGFSVVSIGFTLGFTGGMHAVAKVVSPEKVPVSMGVFMGCQSLGSMFCPYIVNPIAEAVTGAPSALGNFQVAAVYGVGLVIFAFIWGARNRKYYQALPNEAA